MKSEGVAPLLVAIREKRERINREYLRFLRLDLDIAMTFVSMAETTTNPETRKRNLRHARRAYQVVSEDVARGRHNVEDDLDLRRRLLELRDALIQRGYLIRRKVSVGE
jgi:hypothetical protein